VSCSVSSVHHDKVDRDPLLGTQSVAKSQNLLVCSTQRFARVTLTKPFDLTSWKQTHTFRPGNSKNSNWACALTCVAQLNDVDCVHLGRSKSGTSSKDLPEAASHAAAHEAGSAAEPDANLPRRMPLMCKGLTSQQYAALQRRRESKGPMKALAFQYPEGEPLIMATFTCTRFNTLCWCVCVFHTFLLSVTQQHGTQ